MRTSRTTQILVTISILTAGALALKHGRSTEKATGSFIEETESRSASLANPNATSGERELASIGHRKETGVSPKESAQSGAGRAEGQKPESKQTQVEKPQRPEFKFAKELTAYAGLKKKVFDSPEVREEKARLFANDEFLHGLEALLRVPALNDPDFEAQQNDAIDLLLEARATTGGSVPAEILRSLIEDPQIEGTRLDLKSREALAGIKADVLYQWTSQEPNATRDVANWLPGPVSEKIWRNVLAAQEQNRLESMQELQK